MEDESNWRKSFNFIARHDRAFNHSWYKAPENYLCVTSRAVLRDFYLFFLIVIQLKTWKRGAAVRANFLKSLNRQFFLHPSYAFKNVSIYAFSLISSFHKCFHNINPSSFLCSVQYSFLKSHLMQCNKIFQVPPFGLILRTSCVHALNYCRDITKYNSVH